MPKFYCDYCDTYLTHDSPSVRKTHCLGRKHKENVKIYYQKWMEDQAQSLIDATTAFYQANNGTVKGASIPPPGKVFSVASATGVPPLGPHHPGMLPMVPRGMPLMGHRGPMRPLA